jgi:hypothetical protein
MGAETEERPDGMKFLKEEDDMAVDNTVHTA